MQIWTREHGRVRILDCYALKCFCSSSGDDELGAHRGHDLYRDCVTNVGIS